MYCSSDEAGVDSLSSSHFCQIYRCRVRVSGVMAQCGEGTSFLMESCSVPAFEQDAVDPRFEDFPHYPGSFPAAKIWSAKTVTP